MKSFALFFTVLLMPGCPASAQERIFPEYVQYASWAGFYGGCAAVDLNNDTFADLVIAGFGREATNPSGTNDAERLRMSHVLLIDPTLDMLRWRQADDAKIGFNVADRPAITPCDFNCDGNMDIAAFETTGRLHTDQPYASGFSREGIFLGNGDGTFVQYVPRFVNAEGERVGFDMRKFLSGTVADVNNDGRPDIIGIGYQTNGTGAPATYETCNYVLINEGDGTFRIQEMFADGEVYHFEMGFVKAYDLNNDGLQDFIVSAQMNDNAALGRTVTCLEADQCTETHFFDIFLNDPEHPGTFRQQHLQDRGRWGNNVVWAVGECGLSIGDVDSDGVPDLYIVGYCGTGRKHDIWGLFRASLKADGSVTYAVDYTCPIDLGRPLNTVPNQNGFIDWDGDGNLDYVSSGWFSSVNTQTGFIYTNPSGNGNFVKTNRFGSSSELSMCFVDFNADGVNDIVEMGQSWDGQFFLSNPSHFQATLNPNVPTDGQTARRPDAPVLGEPVVGDRRVTLSWQLPPTAKRNATFEYWVKNSRGEFVTPCNSFVGDTADGMRKVVGPGNACQATSVTLTLADGSYTYGVQCVDAAYHGSAFATGSFSIGSTGIASPPSFPPRGEAANGEASPRGGLKRASYYDLQGRKVIDHSQFTINTSDAPANGKLSIDNCKLKSGVYIVNGKKIIKQ